ncbi:hypothetical protein B484DRAFT_397763 [Ochromonadaceae sp. CCMP2298]|nr:hypothetical protein B484DRAFT_397763 [Ochromonadaceae sp. CCMP2298]
MQSVWGAALTLCWGGSMAHLAGCLVERDAQEKGKEKEGEKEKERGEKGEKERVEKDKGEKGEKEKGEREHLDPACVKPGLEEDSISPETTAYSLSLSSARDRELSHDSLVSSEEGATDVEPEHIRPHERTYTDRTEHAESRSHSRQHSHEGPSHARQLSQDAASHRQLSQDAASHPRQHSDSHSRQHSHDGHRLSQEGGGNRFSNTMVEGRPSLLEGRSELEDGMNLDGDEPVFLDSEPDDMDNDQDDQDQDNFYADGFGCKSGDSRDSGELGGLDVDMSRDVGSAGDIGADSPGEPRFSRASPQPVMLRVGSTHVSLSTLEDKAEWRRKNRRKNV